jgi:hypothetical protein
MAINLSQCAGFLSTAGIRHHVDADQGVLRLVFVTEHYRNLRGERLLIMTLETPDDGQRCRASIQRAFAAGGDVATSCLTLCRLAADTPLVAAEYDADFEDLRMVVETVVEDAEFTSAQLTAMVNRLVEAAEVWSIAIARSASCRGIRKAV